MSNPAVEKKESRAERTDRIASAILDSERSQRDKKTAWLREMRLKAQHAASS